MSGPYCVLTFDKHGFKQATATNLDEGAALREVAQQAAWGFTVRVLRGARGSELRLIRCIDEIPPNLTSWVYQNRVTS